MEVRTLCDIFYRATETFRRPELMRFKKDGAWRPLATDEFKTAIEELSMGLRALGLERGEKTAILSENRPEWAFADFATLCAAAIDTPIYSTLTPPQILYILNDCEARIVFVSSESGLQIPVEVTAPASPLPVAKARTWPALAQDPEAVRKRAAEVKPDDLATLIYTSGTTGDPKGVMLVHSNLTSNVLGSLAAFSGIGTQDVALSFLPLCHVFERMGGHYLMLYVGATIAYAESVDKVPQNMLEVRPTLMLSVPRLYEKMYARVLENALAGGEIKKRIFFWARGVADRWADVKLAGETAPAEPDTYRLENYRAPTPATLAGARVVTTDQAEAIWKNGNAVFVDVLPRPPRPPNLPAGTIWRDKPRLSIPGSHWLPDTGYGELAPIMQAYFKDGLARVTGGDLAKPLVIFCLRDCWMSWNAAKRALSLGYSNVVWYPDGTDGWSEAGLPLEDAQPIPRPNE